MYNYRHLLINDIEKMKLCRNLVYLNLTDKSMFIQPSDEFLKKILMGYGVSIGAFANDKLIGFASFSSPNDPNLSISEKIGFSFSKSEQLEHYLVLPEYRNQGIANNMCNLLFNYTKKRYLFCIISPKNIPSIALCFKYNFKIVKLINLKNNYQRYILFKDMKANIAKQKIIGESFYEVPVDDISKIKKMLENGNVGFAFSNNKQKMLICHL